MPDRPLQIIIASFFTRLVIAGHLLFLIFLSSTSYALNFESVDEGTDMGAGFHIQNPQIRIHSVIRIFPENIEGQDLVELSGLAWSEDEQLLYAITDHGSLFSFELKIEQKRIQDINIRSARALKGRNSRPLKGAWRDSEGLAIAHANNGRVGDERLLISFERKHRLAWCSSSGEIYALQSLPEKLADRSSYRSSNNGLEAVTLHPDLGIVTTPEMPLKEQPADHQIVYHRELNKGKWIEQKLKRNSDDDFSVTALETMPDGNILMLLRKYSVLQPTWRLQLQKLDASLFNTYNEGIVIPEVLMEWQVGEGMPADNFEGLTHYKDNLFLMVSDNNEHFMQRTLLVLFEVLPAER